jgi:hypothetical protein
MISAGTMSTMGEVCAFVASVGNVPQIACEREVS